MASRLSIQMSVEARRDLREVSQYHEDAKPGLGGQFIHEAVEALDTIVERPTSLPLIFRDVRRALLHRFPYGIFFGELGGVLRVIAIMDLRRSPRAWRRRA